MKEVSLRRRYSFKLLSQLLNTFLSFITIGMIPRALGPARYGDLNYLNELYNNFLSVLDCGVTTAFFTKLAKRPRDTQLRTLFLIYFFSLTLITLLTSVIALQLPTAYSIFQTKEVGLIFSVMIFILSSKATTLFEQLLDAFALTIPSEKMKVLNKAIFSIGIATLYKLNYLNIRTYLYFHICSTLFLLLIWWTIAYREHRIGLLPRVVISRKEFRTYSNEIIQYAFPLFSISLLSAFSSYFDRWVLQHFYGSSEQGYFSFASYIAGIVFTLAAPLSPLLTREFSRSHYVGDTARINSLITRVLPISYWVVGASSFFVLANTDEVIHMLGGDKFMSSKLTVQFFCLYPLQQVIGQAFGGLFYSSEKTHLYSKIGIISSLSGIFVSTLLLLPSDRWGFSLGAVGLSLKMVVVGWVTVLFLVYYGNKEVNFGLKRVFLMLLTYPLVLFTLAIFARIISLQFGFTAFKFLLINGLIFLAFFLTMSFVLFWKDLNFVFHLVFSEKLIKR